MRVMIAGKRGEGWQVILRHPRFVTRSNLLTKVEAVKLAAYCLKHNDDMMMKCENRGW